MVNRSGYVLTRHYGRYHGVYELHRVTHLEPPDFQPQLVDELTETVGAGHGWG